MVFVFGFGAAIEKVTDAARRADPRTDCDHCRSRRRAMACEMHVADQDRADRVDYGQRIEPQGVARIEYGEAGADQDSGCLRCRSKANDRKPASMPGDRTAAQVDRDPSGRALPRCRARGRPRESQGPCATPKRAEPTAYNRSACTTLSDARSADNMRIRCWTSRTSTTTS